MVLVIIQTEFHVLRPTFYQLSLFRFVYRSFTFFGLIIPDKFYYNRDL